MERLNACSRVTFQVTQDLTLAYELDLELYGKMAKRKETEMIGTHRSSKTPGHTDRSQHLRSSIPKCHKDDT